MLDMDKKYTVFSQNNVPKLMVRLAIPSILMSMVDLICSMINQIFIAQMGSTAMVAAVSVPNTLTMFVFAVGEAVGVSASSYLGRQLGAKNEKSINEVLRTALSVAMLIAVIMIIITLTVLKPYALWQTNSDTQVVYYAIRYGIIALISCLFQVIRNILTYCLRAVGDIKYSTIVVICSIVLQVILDPILMFEWGLNLNVIGLALATMISQFLAMAALVGRISAQKTVLRLKLFDFHIDREIVKEIGRVGSAVYLRDALPSLSMTVMVKLAFNYGTAFEAACSIGRYAIYFVNFFINGITASFLPFAAYNYGGRQFSRLKKGLKFDMAIIMGYSLLMAVILVVWAQPIFSLFDPGDADALIYGTRFLRAYALSLPIYGFYHMGLTILQAAGMGKESMIVSVCRQAVFYIPVIFVAVWLWGQNGIYFTQPICDWCSAAIAIVVATPLLKKIFRGLDEPSPVQQD